MEPIIRVEHLCKTFDVRDNTVHAAKDISFDIERGDIFGIIGLSGAGKSTLVRCLNLLEKPPSGKVLVDGKDLMTLSGKELRLMRRDIGMIFQGGALLDSSTVEENVKLPLDLFTSQSEKEKMERVDFCLQRVRLEEANHLYPAELSGGMIKRVAIARAIVLNPRYLFCDEPNSGLDPQTSIVIDNLIHEISDCRHARDFLKLFGLHQAVLAGRTVEDEQYFFIRTGQLAVDDAGNFAQLVHEICLVVQPPGSVAENHVRTSGLGRRDCVKDNGGGGCPLVLTHDVHARAVRPNLKLIRSGGTESIARAKEDFFALFFQAV